MDNPDPVAIFILMKPQNDITIVGGGLNGPALALAMAQSGHSVTIIDALSEKVRKNAAFDGRSYALALTSKRLLEAVGVWPDLETPAQPMLESVLEEKSQRIAEVLLGSVNSFQLMAGKLLGTVAGSLTVFAIYLVSMLIFAAYKGYVDQIPFQLAPWFVLFQILGVLFYASIFLAIGASVSQLKEAQAMLLPVWLMMMSPIFVWLLLVREPLGNTATMFSLFPPAAPTAMMLRLATGQAIPLWQPIAGALLTAISTLAIVFFAARIFRVGILWQGKTPRIGEILRWAFRG